MLCQKIILDKAYVALLPCLILLYQTVTLCSNPKIMLNNLTASNLHALLLPHQTLSDIYLIGTDFLSVCRLEMQPDVVISQLYMRVEPSDSSYMPSLVVVSGGDVSHNTKELKTVNIGASDTLVTLLQDITEV